MSIKREGAREIYLFVFEFQPTKHTDSRFELPFANMKI
jgi:hypothetical protein